MILYSAAELANVGEVQPGSVRGIEVHPGLKHGGIPGDWRPLHPEGVTAGKAVGRARFVVAEGVTPAQSAWTSDCVAGARFMSWDCNST